MAALNPHTGTTEQTEIVPSELLDAFIQELPLPPLTGESIAWPVPGVGSIVRRFARFEDFTFPTGTKTQTDTFTDVAVTLAESSITPGLVGCRIPISDELEAMAIGGVPAETLAFAMRKMFNRIDIDILSGSTSATNTVGGTSDVFTAAKFRAAAATFRALDLGAGMNAFVGHADAFRDLEESIASTTAPFTANMASSQLFGSASGYKATYSGFEMFETNNVPAEGAGWSNFMTPIGAQRCGLAIVMTEMPNIRRTRGDDAESRATTYYVLRAWYGAGLQNAGRWVEVLSRT
jgi:hypothetical protein